jgi:hypothetical protein
MAGIDAGVQLAIQVLTLLGIGVCIGMVRANYVTQKDLAEHEKKCWVNIMRMFQESYDNRKEVWRKVDRIYDFLLEQKK